MTDPIPSFYRYTFTFFDPLLSGFGCIGGLFSPAEALESYTPHFVFPPATETLALLDVKAAFCAASTFLQAYLLRARPDDVALWRIVQGSNTIISLGMVGAILRALAGQGRLRPELWRRSEMVAVGLTTGLIGVRLAFMMGVGMRPGGRRLGGKQDKGSWR